MWNQPSQKVITLRHWTACFKFYENINYFNDLLNLTSLAAVLRRHFDIYLLKWNLLRKTSFKHWQTRKGPKFGWNTNIPACKYCILQTECKKLLSVNSVQLPTTTRPLTPLILRDDFFKCLIIRCLVLLRSLCIFFLINKYYSVEDAN